MSQSRSGLGPEWDALVKALEPGRVHRELEREFVRGMGRIGLKFTARAVKKIQAKDYAPNSEVTQALKGSSTPLVADGDLMASITHDVDTGSGGPAVWLGVNKKARDSKGKPVVNVAAILHEGATIDVMRYPKVRRALFAQLQDVAKGKRSGDRAKAKRILATWQKTRTTKGRKAAIKRGGWATKLIWKIPERPFIREVLDQDFKENVVDVELHAAPRRAFDRLLKGVARSR